MFRRAQNGKPAHTNLLIKPCDSYRIAAIYKQTNKHVQLNTLVKQVTLHGSLVPSLFPFK